jgi:hypothetical protein
LLVINPKFGATIIYDNNPPILSSPHPDGTSQAMDTAKPNVDYTVSIWAYDDVTSYDKININATVYYGAIKPDKIVSTLTLKYTQIDCPDCIASLYTAKWTTPSTTGNYYVVFTAADEAGNKANATGYLYIGNGPTGTFFINNIAANQQSVIVVKSASLDFKFVPDMGSVNVIKGVYVIINQGSNNVTVTLTYSSTDYAYHGSYTLPSVGKYNVYGYVVDTSNNKYRLMSITIPYGVTGESLTLSNGQVMGFVLIAIGGLMVWRGRNE